MSYQHKFDDIKERVSFEQVSTMLGLSLKQQQVQPKDGSPPYMQWRGQCPKCGGNARSLAISPGKGFTCYAVKLSDGTFPSGTVIDLVAHLKGINLKQAAELIATHCVVPRAAEVTKQPIPDTLAKVHGYLRFEHPDVQAHGLDPRTAEKIGVGYKPTGCFSGAIVWPLYKHENGIAGELVGYAALKDGKLRFFKRITAQV